jgi:predicted RNase H-like nuclease (RuvC/YqgF family)|tara:strand:+ start:597 stop:902 length:306 start_codon:yes stop_codon:yes gene_type:complete
MHLKGRRDTNQNIVVKASNMEEPLLIALISALGVKEIWNIIKKKIDISAQKEDDQIARLTEKISSLEVKIDELIQENMNLKVKLAKMEERILLTAKNRIKK